MNTQLTIITVLVVVSTVSLVINFGLWSDLKQAQADLDFANSEVSWANDSALFWEEAAHEAMQDAYRLSVELDDAVTVIRDMQEDLAYAAQNNDCLRDEVQSLEDMLAAIYAASPITAHLWCDHEEEDRPLPF